MTFAARVGFPAHGLIVGRPGQAGFDKSIDSEAALVRAVEAGLQAGPVHVETDMRAHRNPTRMQVIAQCAQQLAEKLATTCPQCAAVGFGVTAMVPGARCRLCGDETRVPKARKLPCARCDHTVEEALRALADPQHCDNCNP